MTPWEIARLREAARPGGTPTAYGHVKAAVREGMSVGEQRLVDAGLVEARARRLTITAAGRNALAANDQTQGGSC